MEKHYYIIGGMIVDFAKPLCDAYKYTKLTDEQAAFYELHKCSVEEVIAGSLNPPPPAPLLDTLKNIRLGMYRRMALRTRNTVVPDYQIGNVGLGGIYDEETTARIRSIAVAFRNEYYRLEAAITAASSREELELITDNFDALAEVFSNNEE